MMTSAVVHSTVSVDLKRELQRLADDRCVSIGVVVKEALTSYVAAKKFLAACSVQGRVIDGV